MAFGRVDGRRHAPATLGISDVIDGFGLTHYDQMCGVPCMTADCRFAVELSGKENDTLARKQTRQKRRCVRMLAASAYINNTMQYIYAFVLATHSKDNWDKKYIHKSRIQPSRQTPRLGS